MISRLGDENERVMALRGLYEEATAKDKGALEKVLKNYETTIKADPTNMVRSSSGPALFFTAPRIAQRVC
jgi:hypothetical protein